MFIFNAVKSQPPALTAEDVMKPGDEVEISLGFSNEKVSPGSEGENQEWDFSSLEFLTDDEDDEWYEYTTKYEDPGKVSMEEKYPNATVIFRPKHSGWFYTFYTANESGLYQNNHHQTYFVSTNDGSAEYSFEDPLNPPLQLLKFPMQYGDVFVSESLFDQTLNDDAIGEYSHKLLIKDSVIVDA